MVILYKGMAIILTSGSHPVSGGPVVCGMITLPPGGVTVSKKKRNSNADTGEGIIPYIG